MSDLKQAFIKYLPHPGQSEVHLSKARFKVVKAGIRWGKTLLACYETLWELGKPGAKVWWVSPSWSETLVGWRMFLEEVPHVLMADINHTEKSVRMVNNSWVWFKSAEEYEHLRAEGLDFVVADEAARMKRDAWFECLRTRLADKQGKALIISTPKGMNWFYEVYMLGRIKDSGWESFSYPTWTSPFVKGEEIEQMRREMPELLFRQEVGAEFLTDLGSVFRFRRNEATQQIENVRGSFEPPKLDERYVAGADLGKRVSFTVIFVLDSKGHVVAFDRFKTVDWSLQYRRIVNLASQYNNAKLILDSAGVGEPAFDEIRRMYGNVYAFDITGKSRRPLIDNLAIMIENVEVTFPDIPDLMRELEVFGIERTRSGSESYSVPHGFNDDCVFALALAAWVLKRRGEPAVSVLNW